MTAHPFRSARHEAALAELRQAVRHFQQAAIHSLRAHQYLPNPDGAALLTDIAAALRNATQRHQAVRG